MDQIYFNVDRYKLSLSTVFTSIWKRAHKAASVLLDCWKERNLEKVEAALSEHLDWSLRSSQTSGAGRSGKGQNYEKEGNCNIGWLHKESGDLSWSPAMKSLVL